jgi:hypothetical protein
MASQFHIKRRYARFTGLVSPFRFGPISLHSVICGFHEWDQLLAVHSQVSRQHEELLEPQNCEIFRQHTGTRICDGSTELVQALPENTALITQLKACKDEAACALKSLELAEARADYYTAEAFDATVRFLMILA